MSIEAVVKAMSKETRSWSEFQKKNLEEQADLLFRALSSKKTNQITSEFKYAFQEGKKEKELKEAVAHP